MNKICLILYQNNNTLLNIHMPVILITMSLCMITIIVLWGKKYKRIRYNLNYREELFNSMCLTSGDIFIIYHLLNKKFEYISPNFNKILGINSKELIKDPLVLLDHIPSEKKEEIKALVTSSIVEKSFKREIEYHHPMTNMKHNMIIRFYPVFNNNKVIRYIICIIDITNEMKAKKALEDAFLDVQKANEAKKEFISHISHELKTPLNSIIGMTQIASLSLQDIEKVKDCLTKINISSNNLLSMINNILNVSNVDSDELKLTNEPFQLSKELTLFSSMMNSQAKLAHQDFAFILNKIEDDYLLGDSLRLNQIISNCLSNSFKFTPPGGKIIFEVSEIEKYANTALFRFIISDTGKGMREEYIEHIFNPYEQEDSTISPNYGGMGLGMSIAKKLLYLMGGNIHVASKVNEGTIIKIDIIFKISNDINKQTEVAEPKVDSNIENCTKKRVLVVEDNDINSEITCSLLNHIKVETETARNGYEALKLFENAENGYYDAILMDLNMPKLNGYETTKTIRNSDHPDANKICIIMTSAEPLEQNNSFINFGINHYFVKPINIEKLNSILHNLNSNK